MFTFLCLYLKKTPTSGSGIQVKSKAPFQVVDSVRL